MSAQAGSGSVIPLRQFPVFQGSTGRCQCNEAYRPAVTRWPVTSCCERLIDWWIDGWRHTAVLLFLLPADRCVHLTPHSLYLTEKWQMRHTHTSRVLHSAASQSFRCSDLNEIPQLINTVFPLNRSCSFRLFSRLAWLLGLDLTSHTTFLPQVCFHIETCGSKVW